MRTRERFLTPTGAMRAWATVLMLILGFGLALGLTIGYVTKVDKAAERRNVERARDFCGIIVILDDRYQRIPNPPPDQKNFFDEIHRYRLKLGC